MIAKLCTRIIVISEAVKSKFSYVEGNKIRQIYNAVDTEVFKSGLDIEYLHNEFSIGKDKKVVGIFSRLEPWKGHKFFIDAAKVVKDILKDAVFLIVGEGEKKYRHELMEYAETKGIKDSIIFTGFRNNIPQLMNLCDIIVSASIEPEPFGRTIIEAMACSKPVVATNSGAVPEIVEDKITGILVPPEDSEKLAGAVIELLQNKEKARKIGIAGRKRVERLFSIEKHTRQIEEVYLSLLSP